MPDEIKQDNCNRSPVAANENYEVQYLARKLGLTAAEARDMVKYFGNNREALERHKKLA